MVSMRADPDEPEAPSPNRTHVTKAVVSIWRVKVRPFRTSLMRYMSTLENTRGLTEGESREAGAVIRVVIKLRAKVEENYMSFIQEIEDMDQTLVLKGLPDPDSSTSRNMTAATKKRKDYFESTKMRLKDKMEELDVAMDKIESDHLEFLKRFPNAGRATTLPGQPSTSRSSGARYAPVNLILESESKDKPWVLA